MAFRFVDDVATADCAVEIEAETLPGLFVDAAKSLTACMIDPTTVRPEQSWTVELSEDGLRSLLYAWLSELVFIRDSENVLFSDFEVSSLKTDGKCSLSAVAKGEKIDHDRHDIAVEVKAVTMHMFKIEKEGNIWKAFVVYDL
jgi:SHS2 domain-containing protein